MTHDTREVPRDFRQEGAGRRGGVGGPGRGGAAPGEPGAGGRCEAGARAVPPRKLWEDERKRWNKIQKYIYVHIYIYICKYIYICILVGGLEYFFKYIGNNVATTSINHSFSNGEHTNYLW